MPLSSQIVINTLSKVMLYPVPTNIGHLPLFPSSPGIITGRTVWRNDRFLPNPDHSAPEAKSSATTTGYRLAPPLFAPPPPSTNTVPPAPNTIGWESDWPRQISPSEIFPERDGVSASGPEDAPRKTSRSPIELRSDRVDAKLYQSTTAELRARRVRQHFD